MQLHGLKCASVFPHWKSLPDGKKNMCVFVYVNQEGVVCWQSVQEEGVPHRL